MLVASDLELGASDVELGATNLDLPVDGSTSPKIHLLYSIVFARFPHLVLILSEGIHFQMGLGIFCKDVQNNRF